MPTYDYRCTSCESIHSVTHKIDEFPEQACALCEAPMRKVFNIGGTTFRGSGFYSTDKGSK